MGKELVKSGPSPFKGEDATIGATDKASQLAILSETAGRVLRW